MRRARKREHIENYLMTSFKGDNLLGDVYLEHNALPNLSFDDIDTRTLFLGKTIDYPILINAMTGGADFSQEINRDLATLAKEFNIPMAVGSQTIALEEEDSRESFKIVKEIIGDDGIVISNLNGQASVDDARNAIELIDSDALQIHLNPAQELAMEEGDRNFVGVSDNIKSILDNIDKPIIIKEVGFGISKDVAKTLYDIGVRNIDVAGYGGTNFMEIENLRNPAIDLTELYSWGIPTAVALINLRQLPNDLNIISSGGIRSGMDVAKSIVLGANISGISGELLSYLVHGGYTNAKAYLEDIIYKMRMIMLLLGKRDIEELKKTNYKVTGKLKDLI
ncbi:type 2 isopentenyl-diphosphate Delta-isomerase [Paratissierella segnis]|jgi:isopentenyl-diphosphate delta-isomerase|uniref:Isopentenyl-diphosphate delta-isomerase n=1 Tax=Paratissierella segnis TaxID=2763679 RepID=A0A926ETL8_9FIRM|nr:type 2 isopentenyl-diphosphate Delta-isomerase [Paratissierella segnis]MBC8587252.1 type 2 isopentenyl-diphosphate Delta-isomerase [Paratissierella segnis]